LLVWLLANQITLAGPHLRRVVLDLSGRYLKVPFLGPLVDALAKHPGVTTVVIKLCQRRTEEEEEDAAQRQDHHHHHHRDRRLDNVGDRVGALRWNDIEPQIQRLVWQIPHVRSLWLDCTGVVGMYNHGRRLAATACCSSHRRVVIIGGPSSKRKRRE
jgi:hypothetical protein